MAVHDLYQRQQQIISKEYTSILETNLKESLELVKDIAVDLESALVQTDYLPSENQNIISTDESMINLDENFKDLLVEFASIKAQERALEMIDFNDENWYSVLQQKLDRDMDAFDVDQGNRYVMQDPLTRPYYLEFRQKVWEVGNPGTRYGEEDDDELKIVNATITTKCPLTQVPLLEPYTAPCSHSFSKAIFEMVSSGAIICPVSGCQERFGKDDLRVNKGLGKRVARELGRLEVESTRHTAI